MEEYKHFGVRIEKELFKKFKIVCIYEGRSLSRQVWYMIKCRVEEHEKENGKIVFNNERDR